MKKGFWYILIQPIILGIYAPAVYCMNSKSFKESGVSGIANYPLQKDIDGREAEERWKEFSECVYPNRTKLTKTQSNRIEKFWKKCSEHNRIDDNHPIYFSSRAVHPSGRDSWEGKKEFGRRVAIDMNFTKAPILNMLNEEKEVDPDKWHMPGSGHNNQEGHYPSYDSHLVTATNEIILSEKGKWQWNMKSMLGEINLEKRYRDSVAEIMVFQILREFLQLNHLPFKVFLVIHLQLLEMKSIGNNSAASMIWWKELQSTMELSQKCRNQLGVSAKTWQELSVCTYHSRMKLTSSQSNEISSFWKKFSKHNKIYDHYTLDFLGLVKETNEIILSEKDHWEGMMKKMLDDIKIDTIPTFEQISLLQILREFLLLKELPLKVSKVIDLKLIEMQPIENMSEVSEEWLKELEETTTLSQKTRFRLEESEGIWKDFSACTHCRKTQLTKPQSDTIDTFWKECCEHNQEDGHSPKYFAHLVKATNEILLSGKGSWATRMKKMLKKIKHERDPLEQIEIFQILGEFLRFEDLPPKVLKVIDSKLEKMEVSAKISPEMKRWWNELEKTKELSKLAHQKQSFSKLTARLARHKSNLIRFD